MHEFLIREFINRLTIEDVDKFARQNGIDLKKSELNLIYNQIKSDWRTILYGNPRPLLDNLRENLDSLTYNKIENLYSYFKEKYKHYLS